MKMKSYMYNYDFNIYYIHPKCDHSESWLTLNNGLYLVRRPKQIKKTILIQHYPHIFYR